MIVMKVSYTVSSVIQIFLHQLVLIIGAIPWVYAIVLVKLIFISKIMTILTELLDRPPQREKLSAYNTFEDAVQLFRTRKRILVLTGAGVSVSCGIPDFRSKDVLHFIFIHILGIYARLHVDFPDLPDPTSMFDIRYFNHNPAPFYDFASEIFPGQFEPSISHKFIRQLEVNNQLLRNYTQNIDTLEKQAKIERVVECHGSFSKATCMNCSAKFDGDVIRDDVMAKRVAYCPRCTVGVIKPDIVFFGEDLGKDFHVQMAADKNEVDLLVVMGILFDVCLNMFLLVNLSYRDYLFSFCKASRNIKFSICLGSSLKVRPVSLIPFSVDQNVPQILINREPLSSYRADIELLGNCDEIIEEICLALGGGFVDLLEAHQCKMNRDTQIVGSMSKEVTMPIENAPSHFLENGETVAITKLARKRRRIAEKQEFLEIMKKLEISEHCEHSQYSDYESNMKRPKLEDLYERRYIRVEKYLPEHTYFQISPNRAIFPGAELYYDLESGSLCQPVNYRRLTGFRLKLV
ncbi:transcriptional regulator, Sir2 family [Dictyocaulus viviparus]|uniref:Transcriptional regulator, Sir2 family n=1 Tax=Dictyocaulus viviparus TaxID=29172 RepID=A0A0D8YDE8_DICVI|nr:transcriptional regulator, Sir2 family [Dictyocaulus viviparus]